MRNARALTFVALALALWLGQTAKGQGSEAFDPDTDQPTINQGDSSSSHEESKHLSCQALCLADGEDPLDCDSYCIQVAEAPELRCVGKIASK